MSLKIYLFLNFINFVSSLLQFNDIHVSLYDQHPISSASSEDCRLEHYIDKLCKNIMKLQSGIDEIDGEIKRFYETSQMLQNELEAKEFRKTISPYLLPITFCLALITYLLMSSLKSKLIINYKRIKLIFKYIFVSSSDCDSYSDAKSKTVDLVADFNVKMFLLHRNSNINEYLLRHASCKKNFTTVNLNRLK